MYTHRHSEINVESAGWIAPVIHSRGDSDDCINRQERWGSQTTVALRGYPQNKLVLAPTWAEFVPGSAKMTRDYVSVRTGRAQRGQVKCVWASSPRVGRSIKKISLLSPIFEKDQSPAIGL